MRVVLFFLGYRVSQKNIGMCVKTYSPKSSLFKLLLNKYLYHSRDLDL